MEFTSENLAAYRDLVASEPAKPKGRPSDELKAQMLDFKQRKQAFLKGLKEQLGNTEVADKRLMKELDAAAASAGNDAEEEEREAFLAPPSGTRDFFPNGEGGKDSMRFKTWLFDHFRKVRRLPLPSGRRAVPGVGS